jgi:hypothetical protein
VGADGDEEDELGLNIEEVPNNGSITADEVLVVVLKQFEIDSFVEPAVEVGREAIVEPL